MYTKQRQRLALLSVALHVGSFSCTAVMSQRYNLFKKTRLSLDSCLLRFAIPPGTALGPDSTAPTCVTVTLPAGTDVYGTGDPTSINITKSYSPVSHPAVVGSFDLVVKSYPSRPGGGVGAYICGLDVHDDNDGDATCLVSSQASSCNSIIAKLKPPRMIHNSPSVLGRWKHVGLVAGGTGIAPLFQIARILLEASNDENTGHDTTTTTTIHLLYINRGEDDVLLKDEIDQMTKKYPDRFHVTYSLTQPNLSSETQGDSTQQDSGNWEHGRGSAEMALRSLPPPAGGDESTMIFVCGMDGFVSSWGGPVGRAPPPPGKSQGPKIQGPLLGWLAEAGYNTSEVFKY